jgi:hypothetical protein
MRKGRSVLVVAVTIALTGCLSLLEGESVSREAGALPEAERAVLLGRSSWFLIYAMDVAIWSVDGVIGSGAGQRRVEVAPGRHSVEIENWVMIGGMHGTVRYGFDLEMRAGHRYQIHGVGQRPGCVVDIEDLPPHQEEGSALQVPCQERSK